ncbi:MAG: HDIG domain-containing protein [Dehalococcoidia bacterium]|nr:HDIG domain-containing protein [Dehalococcoidia bacterium]
MRCCGGCRTRRRDLPARGVGRQHGGRDAGRIGADALLVRVGAYYHGIGKLVAPDFFIENFAAGANPHAGLDLLQSTRVIHPHVTGGLELAHREGLPVTCGRASSRSTTARA